MTAGPPDAREVPIPNEPPIGSTEWRRDVIRRVGGDTAAEQYAAEQAHTNGSGDKAPMGPEGAVTSQVTEAKNRAAARPHAARDGTDDTPADDTTKKRSTSRPANVRALPGEPAAPVTALITAGRATAELLGHALFDPDKWADLVARSLSPDDFPDPFERQVFVEIVKQLTAGHKPDAITVANALPRASKRAADDHVGTLLDTRGLAENVPTYIALAKEATAKRRQATALLKIRELDVNGSSPDELQCKVAEIWEKAAPAAEAEDDVYRLEPLDWQAVLRDGVPEVEYLMKPYLHKAARILVVGASGVAKSIYCLTVAAQLSREGSNVTYVSEENPKVEDVRRLAKARPDWAHFRFLHRPGIDLADSKWVRLLLETTLGTTLSCSTPSPTAGVATATTTSSTRTSTPPCSSRSRTRARRRSPSTTAATPNRW